jgi:hypothetical protein
VTKSSTTVVADAEFRAHGWRRRRDLLLMRISLSASWKRNFPPLTSKATSVEPPCICRCTTSAWRVVRMLGDRDRRRGVGLLPLAHGQHFEPLEQDPGVWRIKVLMWSWMTDAAYVAGQPVGVLRVVGSFE